MSAMSFKPVADPVVVLDLQIPIQFMGETLTSLAIREPNAGDIFRCGNPVIRADFEDGSVVFDEKKAMSMLSRLTGLPIEGTLERMGPNDAIEAFHGIARFFLVGLRTRPAKPETPSEKPDAPPAS